MPLDVELRRAFDSGTPIVTSNLRAARWLRREYAIVQREHGLRAWTSPAIDDWDSWLLRLCQAHAVATDAAAPASTPATTNDVPLLLTPLQERSVWTRMLREDAALLVSPDGMAALASEAYALLSSYEAHGTRNGSVGGWGDADAERFRQWAADFDRECTRRNWMPRAQLELRLTEIVRRSELVLPDAILLTGFDRTTPAQDALLHAMQSRGLTLQRHAPQGNAQPEGIRAADPEEEIHACAWWARSMVEQNPGARIGVLVPDLGVLRSDVERIFRRVLMPQSDSIFASAAAMPFEFSLGQPFAQMPQVTAAILLLRWISGPLREEELSWLLLSGFAGGDEAEHLAFARFDADRRDSGALSLEIDLPSLQAGLDRGRFPALRGLRQRLGEAQKAAAANHLLADARLSGRWVDLAQHLLSVVGWPGATATRPQAFDSLHYQVLSRWERLLDEIALLDFDGRAVGYRGFLRILKSHAADTIFAPESHGAPIQIMGALESSGQQFHAVWFLRADERSWPLRGRPHPLLPLDVQRAAHMPHATAEADLDLAIAITARIAAGADAVYLSYANRDADGELGPSPLLSSVAEWKPAGAILDAAPLSSLDRHGLPLERVADASGAISWPRDQAAGGHAVLANQAKCPFRAFADERLAATALKRSEWGLSAAERGNLLHRVLETIWSPKDGALHTLDDLKTYIEQDRLDALLAAAIDAVFSDEFESPGDTWMQAYLDGERARLLRLLRDWMNEEAGRVPFEVIACEKKLSGVNVGGLELNLRADRVDKLESGEHILIDYKTGEVSLKNWETPRPVEPQLPLYAVFGNVDDVCGALFARIRAGKTCFTGVLSDARIQLDPGLTGASPLVKRAYTRVMHDGWSAALIEVAEGFLRGDAEVDPRDGAATCKHCPLPGLCRIAELRNPLEEEEPDEMDAIDE
jgi:ATP-dependent helicase/nuclease subunit B